MNGLTTVYDGATILKANGSFGKSKTVTVNNFGGVTYVHLRSPKKDAAGWNTFTISLVEYRELVKMAGPSTVAAIAQNFDLQVGRRLSCFTSVLFLIFNFIFLLIFFF